MYDKKKFIVDYVKEAQIRLEFINRAFEEKRYNTVIREAQTVVELLSKALLFSLGRVVPTKHNIREDLKDAKDLLSKNFQKEYNQVNRLFAKLLIEREPSLYGDVDLNKIASEFYTKDDAEKYIKDVEKFHILCKEELKEFLK